MERAGGGIDGAGVVTGADDQRGRTSDDPFDGLVLDESFVRGAARSESSAAERAAAAQRSRSAHADLQARRELDIATAERTERRARRGRRRRGFAILSVLVAFVAAGALVWRAFPDLFGSSGTASASGAMADVLTPLAHPDNSPSPQRAPGEGPLGTPPATTADGPYQFIAEGPDGKPAAYDPCRPIQVVVNNRRAPADADILLDAALAEVTRRTGLQFVREGTTDEVPTEEREAFQPDRYGDRWAPLLIAWSDRTEYPRLGEDAVGRGGSTHIVRDGHAVFVSGQVTLDGPTLAADGQYGGGAEIQAVLMHELGHVVGLAHVDDPSQLMFEKNNGQLEFGDGDKAGLARLGAGACIARL
jgi:hypothetical protein